MPHAPIRRSRSPREDATDSKNKIRRMPHVEQIRSSSMTMLSFRADKIDPGLYDLHVLQIMLPGGGRTICVIWHIPGMDLYCANPVHTLSHRLVQNLDDLHY